MSIVLASSSPRRRQLLESIGISFKVAPSTVEEKRLPGEQVKSYVQRLATEKADEVSKYHPEAFVIAADTVVFIDEDVLEKPKDEDQARKMLSAIQAREHIVHTGLALQCRARNYRDVRLVETRVRMTAMTDQEIDWYVKTGEPMDKAGAYAVQGVGAMFIDAVHGNYTNIVGLPLTTLVEMMRAAGIDPIKISR